MPQIISLINRLLFNFYIIRYKNFIKSQKISASFIKNTESLSKCFLNYVDTMFRSRDIVVQGTP